MKYALGLPLLVLIACGSSGGGGFQGAGGDDGGGSDATVDGPSSSGDDGSSGQDGTTPEAGGDDGGGGGREGGKGGKDAAGEAAGPGSLTPGTTTLTLTAAGTPRTILLHVPPQAASGPVPLVLALHGNGDTAMNFAQTSGLLADSDALGFVLAAPQGITRNIPVYANGSVFQTVPGVDWDAYNSITGQSVVADHNIDVPMLDALRTQLVGSGSIDVHHMVVYGYSQGGYLSFRYGLSDSADLACAAVLAAADPLSGTTLVTGAARKIPVALQIGTLDSADSQAKASVAELQKNGNPVQWNEIAGAGHVPIPGDPKVPLTWCLGQAN